MGPSSPRQPRILLGQHVSNGDCLYATTVARQIKADYPGCHLTWAIGSPCRRLLDGNPHVDAVWEIPFPDREPDVVPRVWRQFRAEAEARRARGDFDAMFFTQIMPDHPQHFDGMIRSSIFHGYPRPITVPISPVLRLSADEVARVRAFAEQCDLLDREQVLLFECAPQSGQSAITPVLALQLAQRIVEQAPHARVILSSNQPVPSGHPRIHDASALTFRENAELTKYCSLLVGCSSGITWLSTSDAARPLPMIQLVAAKAVWTNSVLRDFRHWKLPTDTVIEMDDLDVAAIPACVEAVFRLGFLQARRQYHQHLTARFDTQIAMQRDLLRQGRLADTWKSLRLNFQAQGFQPVPLLRQAGWLARQTVRRLSGAAVKRKPA